MYTQTLLTSLLSQQHSQRGNAELFKQGQFILQERTKVGSFPHPDLETLVSAGEPCGAWRPQAGRPEDKRNVGENLQVMSELPLNGYIPGSSIRGIVRAWAKKSPEISTRMIELLGNQTNNTITAGKIEFLDAWPTEPTRLSLDIVNPQQEFQVLHQGQGTPVSHYTLGTGKKLEFTVAIRGIPNRATAEEVAEVWGWVEQALCFYGVGSRTASGYGLVTTEGRISVQNVPNYSKKPFSFSLYSQGCYGVSMERGKEELRPSHWRGWLRSWTWRFLLGVMSEDNAQLTLSELFGTIEPQALSGSVRIKMKSGSKWGENSSNNPRFFEWSGKFEIYAPSDILPILLPIIKIAASLGGLGRGWRRPLHIFTMNNGRVATRGTYLRLSHSVKNQQTGKLESKSFLLPPHRPDIWQNQYTIWLNKVTEKWENRVQQGINDGLIAEVFSPTTCAIYSVPGPSSKPVDFQGLGWSETNPINTRGHAMNLVYQENAPRNYKRNPELGGSAAGGGNSHCSWVSIRRFDSRRPESDLDCQEVACLFLGGQQNDHHYIRSRFLSDLRNIEGSIHLFGL
ncbi:MAG: RAMP superfamily CRISPR-associated protein [Snowella sp.]|nr:RAMP superfamily CRISPR-associated protein [Snowella sp.]